MSQDTRFLTIPRISIDSWFYSPETRAALDAMAGSRQLVRLKAHNIEPGGIESAIKQYLDASAPDVLIVEARGNQEEILADLVRLAAANAETSRVIVIGSVNDVNFYQRLIEEGIAAYLVAPVTPEALLTTLVRMYDNDRQKRGNLIAVIGASGGVGSSTIAQNIAWLLAEKHQQKTLLVDADVPFGSCLLSLDTTAERDIADAISGDKVDATYITNILVPITERLELLASPSSLERLYQMSPEKINELIDAIRATSNLSIIDLPHEWNSWTSHILQSAREIIIVTRPDLVSIQNTRNMMKHIASYRNDISPPHYVINTSGMAKRQEIETKSFVEAIGLEPLTVIQHDPRLFSQSMDEGKPVVVIDENGNAAGQFDEIAKMITSSIGLDPSRAVHSQPAPNGLLKSVLGMKAKAHKSPAPASTRTQPTSGGAVNRFFKRFSRQRLTPAE